jgi:hypothetical protein
MEEKYGSGYMQNIKYHILNSTAVLVFSFALATTVNQSVKYSLSPHYSPQNRKSGTHDTAKAIAKKSGQEEIVSSILESGVFNLAGRGRCPAG